MFEHAKGMAYGCVKGMAALAPSLYAERLQVQKLMVECAQLTKGHGKHDGTKPLPIILYCPACGERHVDEGEFATEPHKTHACQECGILWQPALVPTVGVKFLPGCKSAPPFAQVAKAPHEPGHGG